MISEISYTYANQRPACGVDVAIIAKDKGLLYLATILRANDPFKNHTCLPGGHIDPGPAGFGERVIDAGFREVQEELGLDLEKPDMYFVGFYDRPGRDPRGWRISFLYCVTLQEIPQLSPNEEVESVKWLEINKQILTENKPWAFDHAQMVYDACTRKGIVPERV